MSLVSFKLNNSSIIIIPIYLHNIIFLYYKYYYIIYVKICIFLTFVPSSYISYMMIKSIKKGHNNWNPYINS